MITYIRCALLLCAVLSAVGQVRFKALSVSGFKACGLTDTGELYCWSGEGGAVRIAPQLKFRDISLHDDGSCAIALGGEPYCWQSDGDPVLVSGTLRLSSITKGSYFACGLTVEGAAWCWLDGAVGRPGNASKGGPVPVSGSIAFESLNAGNGNTCGLSKTGTVWCWGQDVPSGSAPVPIKSDVARRTITAFRGGLGLTANGTLYAVNWHSGTLSHLDLVTPEGGFASVDDLRELFACGVSTRGTGYCWGRNDKGELGNGSNQTSNTPVPVFGNLKFTIIRAGTANNYTRACGLTPGGEAYCWGTASWIPVPVLLSKEPRKDSAPASAPPLATTQPLAPDERAKQLVVMVEGDRSGAGLLFFAGLDRAYIATAYHVVRPEQGRAPSIQVRFRTAPNRPLQAQITDSDAGLDLAVLRVDGLQQAGIDTHVIPFEFATYSSLKQGAAVRLIGNPGGRRWGGTLRPDQFVETQRSKMYFESSFIRPGYSGGGLFDGDWFLAGMIVGDDAPEGEAIGLETMSRRLRQWRYPVQWGAPAEAPDFTSIGRLEGRNFGVTADNRTYVWGKVLEDRVEPMQQIEGLNLRRMDASCGLTTAWQAFCWEQMDKGGVGQRTVLAPGDTVFESVSLGCGIGRDGKGYCWDGWLGNGAERSGGPTVETLGNHTFQSISTYPGNHTCAVTRAADAYCWGWNPEGQLGDGSQVASAIPVRVTANLKFQSISTDRQSTCAIAVTGKPFCWGRNEGGYLGNFVGNFSAVPVEVPSPVKFKQLSMAYGDVCGIAEDQSVWCWGRHYKQGPASVGPSGLRFNSLQAPVQGIRVGGRDSTEICGLTTAGVVYCWEPGAEPQPSPVNSYWPTLNQIEAFRLDKDYAKAGEAAGEVLSRYPNQSAVIAAYGNLMVDIGNPERARWAIKTLRQNLSGVQSNDKSAKDTAAHRLAWIRIANLQGRMKNLDGAIEALQAAEKLSGAEEIEAIRMERARVYTSVGQPGPAIEEYRGILKSNADQFDALNSLAYQLAQRNESLQEALDLSRRALDDSPEDTDRLDTTAYILIRLGKLDEAKGLLEKAQSNGAARDVILLEHLGDLLLKQGKTGEAAGKWREALEEWNAHPVGERDAAAIAGLKSKVTGATGQ